MPTRAPVALIRRLPFVQPMDAMWTLDFLGAHAIAGVETYRGGVFARVFRAPHGPALISLSAEADAVVCAMRLTDRRDSAAVESAIRRYLDLDADSRLIDAALSRDPALAPLVRQRPGLRCPGALDGFETAVRTIVGQQISVSGARTVQARIVAEHGERAFAGESWLLFPTPEALAAADPHTLPMPKARARSIVALACAVRDGFELAGASRGELISLPGIGPWTADYLRMRIAGDRDVLLSSDLVVRRSADELGIDLTGGREEWAPWRSYVTYHLWARRVADVWAAAR